MWSDDESIQVKIYTLFLLSDGKETREELNYLNTICKELEIETSEKRKILAECRKTIVHDKDNSEIIIQKLEDLLSEDGLWTSIDSDSRMQNKVIWTLINLGYADQEYSKPEQKIVQYLVDRWKINPAILAEFVDTAETILALTKQKLWFKEMGKSDQKIKTNLREINRRIKLMFDNVQVTISESDVFNK